MRTSSSIIRSMVIPAVLISNAAAGDDLDRLKQQYTRGIIVDGGSNEASGHPRPDAKLGIQYHVITDTSDRVSPGHAFRQGERFRLQVIVNQAAYVYIFNRTVTGTVLSRGIEVAPTAKASPYKLLYPLSDVADNHIPANRPTVLPTDTSFRMDEVPGQEKLVVVISKKPIEFGKYFTIESGDHSNVRVGANAGDIIAEFKDLLTLWSGNADFAEAPPTVASRGIEFDRVQSVAVARDTNKPMSVVLSLTHLPE